MKKTLVIIPTYNEATTIQNAVTDLRKHCPDASVLIVDDASPDKTGEIADSLARSHSQVQVLHRASKQGLGPAYLAGFAWGLSNGFDLLVEMDADGSHRAQDLAQMLIAANSADLVLGSRYVTGGEVVNWPAYRQAISRFGNFYARTLLRSKVRDITSGFRVYSSNVLKAIDLSIVDAKGYAFQIQMTSMVERSGAKIMELPITFIERETGKSKMTKRIVFEAFYKVLKWALKS